MLRRVWICLPVLAAMGFAHEDVRVVGVVAKIADGQLDVKTSARTVSVATDDQTRILRDSQKATLRDLKAGQNVVVEAFGDEGDLYAMEIRILPPPSKKQ